MRTMSDIANNQIGNRRKKKESLGKKKTELHFDYV